MTRTRPARFAPLVLAATLIAALVSPFAEAATPTAELEADLIHMVAEEKLAHDVYLALDALYGVPQFARVAASEARHVEAVRGLLSAYGVEDPTVGDAAGIFDDPTFQTMYDDLVAQGSASLEAAAAVGVAIEQIDIADLETALARGLPADAQRVFSNLLAGSEHHLAAFTGLQEAAAVGSVPTSDANARRAAGGAGRGAGRHGARHGRPFRGSPSNGARGDTAPRPVRPVRLRPGPHPTVARGRQGARACARRRYRLSRSRQPSAPRATALPPSANSSMAPASMRRG